MAARSESVTRITEIESAFARMAFPLKVLTVPRQPEIFRSKDLGSFAVSEAAVSGGHFHCVPHAAQCASQHRYVLRYMLRGEVWFGNDDFGFTCAPETFVVLAPSRQFEIRNSGAMSLNIALPGQLLRAQIRNIDALCFRPISAASGAGLLLRDLVSGIWNQRDCLTVDDAANVSGAIIQLLRSVLQQLDSDNVMLPRHAIWAQKLMQVVDRYLPYEDLDAEWISRELGVSRRYLFQIAAAQGTTVGKLIKEKRLEKCRQDLANPSLMERSITEIAFGWGFKDVSHFSHRFSERFAMSPTAFRSLSLGTSGTLAGKDGDGS